MESPALTFRNWAKGGDRRSPCVLLRCVFGIWEREEARFSPFAITLLVLVMWEEVDVRKDGEQQDRESSYSSFLAALCRDGHNRNGVLFEVDAASSMRIGTLCFRFFVRRGSLAHMMVGLYFLGPAFMSLALLRFADEAIQDVLKLEGSKGHSDAFYEFCKGFSGFCGRRRGSAHIVKWGIDSRKTPLISFFVFAFWSKLPVV